MSHELVPIDDNLIYIASSDAIMAEIKETYPIISEVLYIIVGAL